MFIGYFSFYYNKVNIKYRQKSPLERVSLDLINLAIIVVKLMLKINFVP